MTDYAAVLTDIRPGAQWSLAGDAYEGLTWLDDSPKPTKKTLDDAWPQVQYDREHEQVEQQRRARYQAETDGMYMSAIRDDKPLDDWRAAVAQIKTDLPYPAPLT